MIRSAMPGSAAVAVDLPGVPFDAASVVSLELELGTAVHDAAYITVNGIDPRGVTAYLDRPVHASLSLAGAPPVVFAGYVNHIEPQAVARMGLINDSPIQQSVMVCLGASRVMRGKRNGVWSDYTLPELVRSLAEHYRFSYAVPADQLRGRFIQRSESDFELLTKACASLGYRVTVHGTHIHVWDPAKALGRGLPSQRLTLFDGKNLDPAYVPGRVLEMTGSFGKSGPTGDAHDKRVSFLDVDGNALAVTEDDLGLVPTTGRPVRSPFHDDHVITASSYAEAARRLEGAVKDKAPFQATVKVTGVPGLVPGSMVEVVGHRSFYDGLWLVESVKHTVVRSNFISELELSRDTTNEAPLHIPQVLGASPPPMPRLIDNLWTSSLRTEETYV